MAFLDVFYAFLYQFLLLSAIIFVPLIISFLPFHATLVNLSLYLVNFVLLLFGISALVFAYFFFIARTVVQQHLSTQVKNILMSYLPDFYRITLAWLYFKHSVVNVLDAGTHRKRRVARSLSQLGYVLGIELVKIVFLFTASPLLLILYLVKDIILALGIRILWSCIIYVVPPFVTLAILRYVLPEARFTYFRTVSSDILKHLGALSILLFFPYVTYQYAMLYSAVQRARARKSAYMMNADDIEMDAVVEHTD